MSTTDTQRHRALRFLVAAIFPLLVAFTWNGASEAGASLHDAFCIH